MDPKVDEDGYRVIFTYGPDADAEAVAAIHKAIDAMRKMPEAYHAEKGAKLPIDTEEKKPD